MTNETTENFLKAWSEFKWPEPRPISFRLYYDQQGNPVCYTMDDLPGNYIEIDQQSYLQHLWNVRVVNQKLVVLPQTVTVNKLVPGTEQGVCCDPRDVTVVVNQQQQHVKWNSKNYEAD